MHNLPPWLEDPRARQPAVNAVDALLLAAYADNGTGFFGLPLDFAVLAILSAAVYALGLVRVPRLTWSGK